MPRAALDSLPLEVTHQIFTHLGYQPRILRHPNSTDLPDVYFRDHEQEPSEPACVVQPFLYREFMLGYGDSWRSDKFSWKGRLFSFMRTVAHRRDLASQVKRIYIHPQLWETHRSKTVPVINHWMSEQSCVWRSRSANYRSEIQELLCDLAEALGIDGLRKLSEDDLIAILISELPTLQHCILQVGVDDDEIAPGAGLRAAAVSRLLIKTFDLELCATASEARRSFGHASIVHRAFSLLSLSVGLETLNLHEYYGVMTDKIDPIPPLPSLKNLRLTFSWLSEQTLQRLLSSCVHLDLRLRGFTHCTPEPWESFSFEQFTTLKRLLLTLDEFHTVYMNPHPSPDQGLSKLLPPRITSLSLAGQITAELPHMEESLSGLAKAVSRGELPDLKVVRWDEYQMLSADFPVHSLFSAAGVDFGYRTFPLSKSTLGESQSIVYPSYFDDGYRVDNTL
ncbi:hypothetical protein BJX64DRAFT_280230 [Aspergillus heterothallicus]